MTFTPSDALLLNHYQCEECDVEWSDKWSCACNDRCPVCNAETEPYDSEEIEGDEQ